MNILKRFLSATVGSLMLFAMLPPAVHAGDLILGGQTHQYKVVMRGDGRAIVIGKLIVPNTGDNTMTSVNIDLGVADAAQVTAYQLIVPQGCSKFDTSTSLEVGEDMKCIQYKDISTRDFTNAEYQKISAVEVNDSSYTLNLPSSVGSGASAAIVLAYSTKEYTHNVLGLYSYDFKTPTVDDRIESVSVTVQTDSDLYLKGKDTTIHYNDSIVSDEAAYPDTTSLSVESALTAIDSRRGNTVKESASDLFPGESYEITGAYSEYWWRLYLGRIVVAIVIAGALLGLAIWRYKKMPKSQSVTRPSPKTMIPVAMTDSPAFMGFFTALMVGVWTVVAMNILEGNIFGRLHNDTSEILAGLVIFMIYLLVGLGPSISIGHRKGWNAGILTFVSAIIFLIIGIALFNSADISPVVHHSYEY